MPPQPTRPSSCSIPLSTMFGCIHILLHLLLSLTAFLADLLIFLVTWLGVIAFNLSFLAPDNGRSMNSFHFLSLTSKSWPRTAKARGNTAPKFDYNDCLVDTFLYISLIFDFFCSVFDLLHLLVSCELGLHFVKKSWFALSEIYLTKLTTNYIGNVCFSFRHTGFHWWANTFELIWGRHSWYIKELVEHSSVSHLGHFNIVAIYFQGTFRWDCRGHITQNSIILGTLSGDVL